ncbi:hypothetical protein [Streptomyces nymphaeiformis]|uniref:Uncharacterized protein n=1 Tax=Streptomyces nymphaeiformis TaxID=2663842 RepID=A0A7W7U4T8_9ACTN|nr:hypothetical protein [Streptomyces nymphaeiformis]MBB4984959.1 hypothetical protein [Streptomyces nymphaeiformis]
MTPQTAIVSALLCDLDAAPAPVRDTAGGMLLRSLGLTAPDPDYAASIRDGHTESLDDWTRRVLGRETP